MKGRRIKGRQGDLGSTTISRDVEYSVEVSRTIGWTMMDGDVPEEYEAGAAALLPATVKAEISTPLNKNSFHQLLFIRLTPLQHRNSL